MTPQPQHPDVLFMITRDELDRCCSQMSAAGYKVSANYVEAMVLSRPAPSPLEKVLLCFGNYWECPIDEEECEVSDPCHQKAIRDREHDEQVKRKAREEVLNEICAINKGDGCCDGKPHGKDCFDCAFIPLRSEVKKE